MAWSELPIECWVHCKSNLKEDSTERKHKKQEAEEEKHFFITETQNCSPILMILMLTMMREEGEDYIDKTYYDQWHQGSSRGLVHLPYQRGRMPLPSSQSPPLYISMNYDISINYNIFINIKCSKTQRGTYTACRIPDQPGWSLAQHQESQDLCSRCTSLGLGWLLNIISILVFLYTPEHYHHL